MRAFAAFTILLALPATSVAASADITGNWIVEDRSAVVLIARCGSSLCGRIVKPLRNQPGHARTDVRNPNPALRGRPIIGMTIISGFRPDGPAWRNGRIYDPESGRSYRSILRLNGDGTLKVSGCVAFICKSQRWTRAR